MDIMHTYKYTQSAITSMHFGDLRSSVPGAGILLVVGVGSQRCPKGALVSHLVDLAGVASGAIEVKPMAATKAIWDNC